MTLTLDHLLPLDDDVLLVALSVALAHLTLEIPSAMRRVGTVVLKFGA